VTQVFTFLQPFDSRLWGAIAGSIGVFGTYGFSLPCGISGSHQAFSAGMTITAADFS
jgi:hypothetical protein